MPILHLICGLPGAGKSTLARAMDTRGEGLRLTPDDWMLSLGFDLYDAASSGSNGPSRAGCWRLG